MKTIVPRLEEQNIRFWAYVNGTFVKLTLRPGDEITHCEGGPHEEGYEYQQTTWAHAGDRIQRRYGCESKDCDGRYSSGGEDEALVSKLRDYTPYFMDEEFDPHYPDYRREAFAGLNVMLPTYDDVDHYQRDYAAEAAGY